MYYRKIRDTTKLCWFKKGRTKKESNEYIKKGVIDNQIVLIVGGTGSGKSVFTNVSAYDIATSSKPQRTIFYITEKEGEELANAMHVFLPKESYHKNILKLQQQKDKTIPEKIYHPLTLNLPYKEKLPEIVWYADSVNSISKYGFQTILSTDSDVAIDVCLDICRNLPEDATLYDFLNILYVNINNSNKKKVDKITLLPEETIAGDKRTVKNVNLAFKGFFDDYMIHSSNSPFLLDYVDICNDNEHIHHLTTKYITDEKRKIFAIVQFLNNLDVALKSGKVNKQVVIVLEEIKILFPNINMDNYLKSLLNLLYKLLSRIRTKAFIIATAQSYFDVNSSFTTLFNKKFLGKIDANDKRRLLKDFQFNKDEYTRINQLQVGEFVLWESDEYSEDKISDKILIDVPVFANHEQGQDFFSLYRKEFPNKVHNNVEIYNKLRNMIENDRKVRMDKNKHELLQQKKDKEIKELKKDGISDEAKEKISRLKDEKRDILKKQVYDLVLKNSQLIDGQVKFAKGWSWRKITRKVSGINHHETAKNYYFEYLHDIEKQEKVNRLPNLDKPNPNKVFDGGKYA